MHLRFNLHLQRTPTILMSQAAMAYQLGSKISVLNPRNVHPKMSICLCVDVGECSLTIDQPILYLWLQTDHSLLCILFRNSRHRQFQCFVPGCPNKRGFGRFCDLQRHSRTVHGTSRPFECTYCSARFKRRDHLRTHEAVVHVSKGHKIFGSSNKGAVSL